MLAGLQAREPHRVVLVVGEHEEDGIDVVEDLAVVGGGAHPGHQLGHGGGLAGIDVDGGGQLQAVGEHVEAAQVRPGHAPAAHEGESHSGHQHPWWRIEGFGRRPS